MEVMMRDAGRTLRRHRPALLHHHAQLAAERLGDHVRRGRIRQDAGDHHPHRRHHHQAFRHHGQVRSTQARLAGPGRVGHVVGRRARHESRLPVPAEHAARRAGGGAQHQHLRQACRPAEAGQHRADDQRAAGDDPHQGREDGPDADLSRLRNVQVVPGRRPPCR